MPTLLALSLLLILASALNCPRGRDSECHSVTTDIQFVQCVNNDCVCRDSQGFTGLATPSSRCTCAAGYSIFYQRSGFDLNGNQGNQGDDESNIPYCVKLTDAVAYAHQTTRNDILTGVVTGLYTSLVWPGPFFVMTQLITGNTIGGIWDSVAPDAVGRVDPAGDFSTKDGIVEYLYGAVWTPESHVLSVNLQKLIVEGDIVYVDVDIFFNNFDANGTLVLAYNLTQSGSFTFNTANQIQSMDLIIHNLGFGVNRISSNQPEAIVSFCELIVFVANCTSTTDPGGFYTDFNDCLSFFFSIPFGSWDNLRTNSAACRSYHAILAIARPQVHCPHAGKTGGGKCVDIPYEDLYLHQF